MDYEAKKIFLVNAAFTALIGGIVYFVSKFMLAYLLPFLIAVALAFLFHKPASYLQKKTHISAGLWRCMLILSVYIAVAGLIIILTVAAARYSGGFYEDLKAYFGTAGNLLERFNNTLNSVISGLPEEIRGTVNTLLTDFGQKAASAVAEFISGIAASAAKFLPPFLVSSVVTVVASFYIAKDYNRLVLFLRSLVGKKRYTVITEIKEILVGSVCRLMGGYLIIAAITLLEVWLGLMLCSVKYSFIIAVLIALVDLLPVLGSGTVLVPWSVFCFVGGNTGRGVGLLVLYAVITVIKNFIEPKIIGKKLHVNPLLMLITIFVGLRLGGLAGMLILPVTVIVIITYYKNQMERESKRNDT